MAPPHLPKIVSTGILPDWVQRQFQPEFEVQIVSDHLRDELLRALGPNVLVLIGRGSTFLDAEVMEAAPNLKVIARTGVGYDSIDIRAATRRRIPVVYTPGAMSVAVAEHTVMLALAAIKRLPFWERALRESNWQARYIHTGMDLEGSTVGIVGYGRIGRRVRQLLRSFDTRIAVNDPYLDPSDFIEDEVTFVSLPELLSSCDLITLHVPLTEETTALINSRNIHQIKGGAVLVNTARGPVIESLDLILEALNQSRLRAVGLDVFVDEPPDPGHPIFRHPAAVLTGHVAARSAGAQRNILNTIIEEVRSILSGHRPTMENIVNPEVFDRLED